MIRNARPADAPQAVPLLFQAMYDVACKLAGTTSNGVLQPLFEHFFRQPGNQYSYEHTLVFEDERGLGGIIVGYDGALLEALREPVLSYISAQLGHAYLPGDETGPGEYYLDSIAVAPASQGKGIGRQLIYAAEDKARAQGHPRTGLLVSDGNPDARRLYERLGYTVREAVQFSGGNYLHLVKMLS
ncbi:GNAT family N-acetyltransferase [Chitinophaga alhagiae]|uniref:GNAT family N-acetyltransferase n=1 Tax=Chitinophaga alhagiae TaxID=2203219 RepID=UPI00130069DF|nr:GNAT family N-acetyltransferase [Chitinophaga alhagiae]